MDGEKNVGVAYALWGVSALTQIHGLHHFYLGRVGMGLLNLFTFGLCGIGWIIDAIMIPGHVAEANAIAHGDYDYDDRGWAPRREYREQSGGGAIGMVLAIIGALTLMGCGGFMVFALFVGEAAEMEAAKQVEWERKHAQRVAEEYPEPVKTRSSGSSSGSNKPLSKNPEVRKLQKASREMRKVISTKLDPLIERYTKDLASSRKELKRLRVKVKKKNKSALKRAKKLIEECKEIKGLLGRLEQTKERYEGEADKLEFTTRSLERKLEMAELLGEDDKKELAQLVARSQTLVEQAEAGFKGGGSLESEVEKATDEPDESDLDPDLEAALDEELGD